VWQAHLTRFDSSEQGTFGRLSFDGSPEKFFVGELPWRGNAPSVSCIPAGTYKCVWTYSTRFKRKMYLVAPVLGRSGIRIHAANLMGDSTRGLKSQLNGCLAIGEKLGTIDGQKALLLSRPALYRLESLLRGNSFELEITECFNG
jgi:hypothetical protein